MTRSLPFLWAALVGAAAPACTASYPTEPTTARPIALYLAYQLPKGRVAPGPTLNTYTFIAYTRNSDGAFERVSAAAAWSSSDEGIVRAVSGFTSSGAKSFTAVAPGNAEVIARVAGLEARAPVLIVGNDVTLRTPRIDLAWSGPSTIGSLSRATATLRAPTGSPRDVTSAAVWSSADPGIATVTDGNITAVSAGTTIITATFEGLVDWFWFSTLPR